MRQMGFVAMLNDLVNKGSQFIIATHSPIIMSFPRSWTYVFGRSEIVRIPYAETEHFRVTRDFLNHPERSLSILFDESGDE